MGHNNNLDRLFDFQDETGVLEKLKGRYASEDFTVKADLKIVFTDLIRSLCDWDCDQNKTLRPLTKIDGYQHLTNMLLMAQFQSRDQVFDEHSFGERLRSLENNNFVLQQRIQTLEEENE